MSNCISLTAKLTEDFLNRVNGLKLEDGFNMSLAMCVTSYSVLRRINNTAGNPLSENELLNQISDSADEFDLICGFKTAENKSTH